MDKHPPALINGRVKVNSTVKAIMARFGEGGWIAMPFSFEYELPKTLGLSRRLMSDDFLTAEMDPGMFTD